MSATPTVVYVVIAVVFGFGLAWALTAMVRLYALRTRMLDLPNERSSHEGEVPRGGGLAIVLVMLAALCLFAFLQPQSYAIPIAVVVLVLGGLGWVDDRYTLGPLLKIFVQSLLAIFVVSNIGMLDGPLVAGFALESGPVTVILTVLWVVWMTNAYNFMDGIDGIAAGHSSIVACFLGLWFAADQNAGLSVFCYVIMSAALGFLVWNWSPARIFMGDVGSLTLGGVFAVLAIIGNSHYQVPLVAYVVLFGVFLFDTVVTFVKRLMAGKKVWNPHREHYYQRAVHLGMGHAYVTVCVIIASLILAILASLEKFLVPPEMLWGALALALLIMLAVIVRAKEKSAAQHT